MTLNCCFYFYFKSQQINPWCNKVRAPKANKLFQLSFTRKYTLWKHNLWITQNLLSSVVLGSTNVSFFCDSTYSQSYHFLPYIHHFQYCHLYLVSAMMGFNIFDRRYRSKHHYKKDPLMRQFSKQHKIYWSESFRIKTIRVLTIACQSM